MCKLTILILTKNEEKSLVQQLDELSLVTKTYPDIKFFIALVDDSSDSTRKIAESRDIKIIDGGQRGLGAAYRAGLQWVAKNPCDYVLTYDGDGQVDITEFHFFWKIMNSEPVDMLISSRFKNKDEVKYKYPRLNRFGVYLLSKYLTLFSGQKFTDSHGGLRLFKWQVACEMEIKAQHSYVQVSSLSAIRKGFKVMELSSVWKKRDHGVSRVVHSKFKYIKKMAYPLLLEGIRCVPFRMKNAHK